MRERLTSPYTVVYSDGSQGTVHAYNLIWAWKKAKIHAKTRHITVAQIEPDRR
jgi:hypothetical protein